VRRNHDAPGVSRRRDKLLSEMKTWWRCKRVWRHEAPARTRRVASAFSRMGRARVLSAFSLDLLRLAKERSICVSPFVNILPDMCSILRLTGNKTLDKHMEETTRAWGFMMLQLMY
jgi:hypothetical protein